MAAVIKKCDESAEKILFEKLNSVQHSQFQLPGAEKAYRFLLSLLYFGSFQFPNVAGVWCNEDSRN